MHRLALLLAVLAAAGAAGAPHVAVTAYSGTAACDLSAPNAASTTQTYPLDTCELTVFTYTLWSATATTATRHVACDAGCALSTCDAPTTYPLGQCQATGSVTSRRTWLSAAAGPRWWPSVAAAVVGLGLVLSQ